MVREQSIKSGSPNERVFFAHPTRIDYRIRMSSSAEGVEASGLISLESDRDGNDLLQQLVPTRFKSSVPATADLLFFTMLLDMAACRRLVETLDADGAMEAPTELSHPLALNDFESTSPILVLATKSKVFSLRFMRSSDSYLAFKNAAPSALLWGCSPAQTLGRATHRSGSHESRSFIP
jgi:hypothetical protein